MQLEKYDFFPVPVFITKYSKAEELRELLVPKLKSVAGNDNDPERYASTGYTNYHGNDNVLDWKECEELKDFIGQNVANAHTTIGLDGVVAIENSWFSINRKHSYHEKHNHLPSTWSGVYYVQANEKDSGLSFVNPNLGSNWPFIGKKQMNDFTASMKTVQVETGFLWLFPSYLEHKVDEQLVEQERITIAFNFKGVYAEETKEVLV